MFLDGMTPLHFNAAVNPYIGKNFIGFLALWMQRLKLLLTFELSIDDLVIDEIQVFTLMSIAVSCALVGTFLVLRRMTMLANSLSHTILLGIVLAYIFSGWFSLEDTTGHTLPFGAMLIGALSVGFLTTYITEFLTHSIGLQEDASVSLTFTSLFALSIILVTTLARNAHIGIEAVMGNADALHKDDLFWVVIVAICNICICTLCFKEFQVTTFDAAFAAVIGISPVFFNYLLMAEVSLTTISSFRAVGVLLVLGFITGPVIAARLLVYRVTSVLWLAAFIGMLSTLLGVALTRHMITEHGMALSTSGVVASVLFLITFAIILGSYLKNSAYAKAIVVTQR